MKQKTRAKNAYARSQWEAGGILLAIVALLATTIMWAPSVGAADVLDTPDPANPVARHTAVAIDSAGNPVVAYYDQGNTNLKLLRCGNPTCSAGNSIATAHVSPRDVGSHVSLVLDDADNPVMAYRDETNSNLLLMRCSEPDCTGPRTIEQPDDSGDDIGEHTSIALNSAGNPVIAYHAVTGRDLRVVVCDDLACEPAGNIKTRPDRTGAVGFDTSLVLDSSDRPVVAYLDVTESQLKVLRCGNTDCTVTPGTNIINVPDTTTENHGNAPSVVLNAAGNPVIAYSSNGELKVLRCTNATCGGLQSPKTVDSGGNVGATGIALALDPDQFPVVVYQDSSASQLKTLRCFDLDCAIRPNIYTPDGRNAGNAISMRLTADYRPVVAYNDNSVNTLKVLICDDTDCGEPPLVTNDGFTLDEDTIFVQASPNVLSNDIDSEGFAALTATLVTPPANGDLTLSPDGSMVYEPDPDFYGTDSFVYAAHDRSDRAEATATFTVRPVNDAPATADDASTTPQGSMVTVNVVDGSAGGADTDADADVLTVTAVTGFVNGAATFTGPTVTYTPNSGYVGTDAATYTVVDGRGATGTAELTITVTSITAANQDPIAANDTTSTTADTAITVNVVDGSAGGIDTDADGDALAVTGVAGFSSGTATFVGETISYTPNAGFTGVDDATYTIADGTGGADTATLTITVGAAPAAVFCDGKVVTHNMALGASGTGTAGDDVFLGTAGADTINGLGGDDTVCAEGGDDIVNGGDGTDFIYGGDGNDVMTGGVGNDRIRGQQGIDTIDGGLGNDFLYGGVEGDTINGGEGRDTIGGFGGADIIDAGPGNDTVFGGFGADTIHGGDGNDTVFGLIGNDVINGDAGNDTLNGDNGQDTIHGNAGNDTLNGGNSLDTLFGDDGDDVVNGGKSDDTLSGGPGNDTCTGNKETVADTADATCEQTFGVP